MTQTERVFNVPANQLSQTTKDVVYMDILRTLFFARIAQLELGNASKAQHISAELRDEMQKPLDGLKNYDHKILAMINPDKAKWLSKELSKDKVYDIENLVEVAARVNDHAYEQVMGMMTSFLEQLLSMQRRNGRISMKKYAAIFRFLAEELRAEGNGQTAVYYDTVSDSITFKLVQPKSNSNAVKQRTATGV